MKVVVWRTAWLPGSETFVRNQMDALPTSHALAVGASKIESPISRDEDLILYPRGRLDKFARGLFNRTGISRRLVHVLERERPDVVHAHFAGAAMLARRSAVRTRTPLVVTLHGRDITADPRKSGLGGAYYRWRLRRVFRDAALVLAVSQHLADLAVSFGARRNRVVVHHIGIPLLGQELSPSSANKILAVGRLAEKKGFDHLIRAVAKLPDHLRTTEVTIVGEGPREAELRALADECGVDVRFTGFLPGPEVHALMAERPLVCIPSVIASDGDEEGLPTVAMEAGAHGCAVVGYIHSGLPDVVATGETGILVEEARVDLLAEALATLLDDRDRADDMGRAACQKVRTYFDIAEQSAILEKLYASAVAASRTQRARDARRREVGWKDRPGGSR